jgi:hypothetical protein
MGQAAAARPRRRIALFADPAGRLARRAAGRPGAPKDPREYARKLRFHQKVKSARDYGVSSAVSSELPHVVIHTDGACSGNPGPGGWGAILTFGDHEKELKGGEPNRPTTAWS